MPRAKPKRKAMSAPRKPLPPPPPWWQNFLPEHTGSRIVTAAAVITALLYIFGFLRPWIESGPPPLAGRAELGVLKTDVEDHIDTLNKSVDETLSVAKAASNQAQQAIQQVNDSRLDRLIQQKIQLEDQVRKSPGDAVLATALARTIIDIGKLTGTPSAPIK